MFFLLRWLEKLNQPEPPDELKRRLKRRLEKYNRDRERERRRDVLK